MTKSMKILPVIWSVLLCGATTWMLKKANIKQLKNTKGWFCEKMEKIS